MVIYNRLIVVVFVCLAHFGHSKKHHHKWEKFKNETSEHLSKLGDEFSKIPSKIANMTDEFSTKLKETADKINSKKINQESDWSNSKNFSASIVNEIIDQVTGNINQIADVPDEIDSRIDDFKAKIEEIRNDESLQNCFKHKNKTACRQLAADLGDKVVDRAKGLVMNVRVEGEKCFHLKDRDACLRLVYKFGHFGFNVIKCGFGSYSACLTVMDYVANDQTENGVKQVKKFKKVAKEQLKQAIILQEILSQTFTEMDYDNEVAFVK